jgi:hypothetical protein
LKWSVTLSGRYTLAALPFNGGDITIWNAAMVYVVQAIALDGKSGKFTAEAATKRAAIKSAQHFRRQGFVTTVTGPDGKPVDELDETDGEPANPRW